MNYFECQRQTFFRVIGSVIGSVYERFNIKREDFPLLSEWSRPTDDSIMTLAVAKALMNSWGENDEEIKRELVRCMQHLGRKYPRAGYGGHFRKWLQYKDPRPYYSYGMPENLKAKAMRILDPYCREIVEEFERFSST